MLRANTERIHYSVADGDGFTKTLIVSRQVLKHTWESITDTSQEHIKTLLFPKQAKKNPLPFTTQKKTEFIAVTPKSPKFLF